MRQIKLIIVLALFGFITAFSFHELRFQQPDEPHESYSWGAPKVSFMMGGSIDEAQYSFAEVSDTLQWFMQQWVATEGTPVEWGFDVGTLQMSTGQWVSNEADNFRCWAEITFSDRGEREAWFENIARLPLLKMVPAAGPEGISAGYLDLQLPLVDGSGRWLQLSGLRYEYV